MSTAVISFRTAAAACLAASLLAMSPTWAATSQKPPRGRAAQRECRGPECTCCTSNRPGIRRLERRDVQNPQRAVKRGEKLLAYKQLSDAAAIREDIARIKSRSNPAAQPHAAQRMGMTRGRLEATADRKSVV